MKALGRIDAVTGEIRRRSAFEKAHRRLGGAQRA